MEAKIIDYIDGRIVITPEAFTVTELNNIIKVHGDGSETGGGAEPYLAYVHLMTWPESPHINLPEDEKEDSVIFDVTNTIGEFDMSDPLLQPAIERLNKFWETKSKRYYDSLAIAMDKASAHLRVTEVTSEGRDANIEKIHRMIKDASSTLKSFKEVEKTVSDEIKIKMRGKSTLGEY